MNKAKLVELILEDPSTREVLTAQARKDLFIHYLNNRPAQTYRTKKEEVTDLYLMAHRFGVYHTDKVLAEHFNVPRTTIKKRVDSARASGLLLKPRSSI
jgi:hypothetical protein